MNDPQESTFSIALLRELLRDMINYYGDDNWDSERFGKKKQDSLKYKIMVELDKIRRLLNSDISILAQNLSIIQNHYNGLSYLYNLLEDNYSQSMLIKVIAYRILGYRKVKLPLNNSAYWLSRSRLNKLADQGDTIQANYNNWKLSRFNLGAIGYPLKVYSLPGGILINFVLKQYEYKNQNSPIKALPGDFVIDAGGGWGDTALFFAHEVGNKGKVFSFEFIPSNIDIMMQQLKINPGLKNRIELIQNALWSESNLTLYYVDRGPGSRVNLELNELCNQPVKTQCIDDFIQKYEVSKIDFIKMDIEGSELNVLKGAEETIRKFKPKLAIAVYHRLDDFVEIPKFISSLDLGYKFYLDHFTIYSEETILFAD